MLSLHVTAVVLPPGGKIIYENPDKLNEHIILYILLPLCSGHSPVYNHIYLVLLLLCFSRVATVCAADDLK